MKFQLLTAAGALVQLNCKLYKYISVHVHVEKYSDTTDYKKAWL